MFKYINNNYQLGVSYYISEVISEFTVVQINIIRKVIAQTYRDMAMYKLHFQISVILCQTYNITYKHECSINFC